MRIYVSGSWASRDALRPMAQALRAMGHQVSSSWLDEQAKPAAMPEMAWRKRIAMKDIAEVSGSDAILMDISEDSTTGGRYVEWGVACNPHAYILRILVGPQPAGDFFGHLADYHFPDWDRCLAFMQSGVAA